MKSTTLYPLVFADIALFSIIDESLRALLVQRAQEPSLQQWALPGGILKPDLDASLEGTAKRVLRSKVSVDIQHLEEIRTFSGPDRDPRGWSISVLYCALLPYDQVNALVKNKVDALEWADASNPGRRMAFDHTELLATALATLRTKVDHPSLPLHLMPEKFTLTALQQTCEIVLGRKIDKAAFRRRVKGSPDLVELAGEKLHGPHTPAQLYKAVDEFKFDVPHF